MTLVGNMGRWHGGKIDTPAMVEQTLRNEIKRHETQLTEWLFKRADARLAISNHHKALRRLRAKLAKLRGTS